MSVNKTTYLVDQKKHKAINWCFTHFRLGWDMMTDKGHPTAPLRAHLEMEWADYNDY